jgi:hypothetical protein
MSLSFDDACVLHGLTRVDFGDTLARAMVDYDAGADLLTLLECYCDEIDAETDKEEIKLLTRINVILTSKHRRWRARLGRDCTSQGTRGRAGDGQSDTEIYPSSQGQRDERGNV